MGNDDRLVVLYRLRKGHNPDGAFKALRETVGKYRGFEVEGGATNDLEIIHHDYAFVISIHIPDDSMDGMVYDIIQMECDAEYMLDAYSEDNPEFWKYYQNAIAVVAAVIDPWYAVETVDEKVAELVEGGLEAELKSGGYFSFDYIRQTMPTKENAIRKYATRELEKGIIVEAFVMETEVLNEFRYLMEN